MTGDRPISRAGPAGTSPSAAVVDLSEQVRAAGRIADRSRADIWSLAHLRLCWTVLLAGGLLLAAVGAVVTGWAAVLGVALGTAIVGAFFTVSAVAIARVGASNPRLVMLVALFTYVFKVLALAVVLVLMPIDGPFDTRWMAGAIALGVFGWLGAHMRYVWTLKIYYVDPGGTG